jgi:hypothetical protein
MTYKTHRSAVRAGRRAFPGRAFVVYQFPKGHWGYASLDSPIYRDLSRGGAIYSDLEIAALQWDLVL